MSIKTFLTTWTTDGQFRPPSAYNGRLTGLGGFRGLFHRMNRLRRRSSCNCLMAIAIPTVHASASATAEGSVIESPNTTIDLLAQRRPKIVITENDIQAVLNKETGHDRLRVMFSKDHTNDYSYELKQAGFIATGVGTMFFVFTAVLGGNAAVSRYLEKDKAKIHDTKFLAHRAYNDAYAYGAIKLGLEYALKTGFFTAAYLLTANAIAVYRNKSSVFEYVYAGALVCGLLRTNLGMRGWFAGTLIGSVLGAIYGACACATMYATKETQQDRHYRKIYEALQEEREIQLLQAMDKTETLSESISTPAVTAT